MVPITFALLLFAGVPIALVLSITAAVYIWLSGNEVLFQTYSQQLFAGVERYGLLAIPLFMLVGELMNEGGITKRLVAFASVFVGALRGGLAYINLVANMLVAAIIGSANAQIAVMGRVMVPEMQKAGYDRNYAAALTAAGGLLSPIIPPSMLFVIYGVLAQVSIGDMFLAGIIPGLLMGGAFMIIIAILGFFTTYPKGEKKTRQEAISALLGGLPALIIPIVIIGGIVGGIATPTESAALAALAALAVGTIFYREFHVANVPQMLMRLVTNSSTVLFLVATANVFGWIIVYERLPQNLAAFLTELTTNPFLFMLFLNLMLLVVGAVIEGIAALILIVPIMLPIAVNFYGIDPFHFGVVVCLNLVIGLLTPPVGTGLFIAASVSGCKPAAIMRQLLPFLGAALAVLLLITWQPFLVTALLPSN